MAVKARIALVTRPAEDAGRLAAELEARGITAMIEPLLEIVPTAAPLPDLSRVQGLLFTSANGVRAFASRSERRDLPVFAVGPATALEARRESFARIETAGGDVEKLAELARSVIDPKAGALLHVAGTQQAGDLAGALQAAGFTVIRAMLYEARAATAFTPQTLAALAAGTIDYVLLFSPRTAQLFSQLAREAGLDGALDRSQALCLSSAVAASLALRMGGVKIAGKPDQEALLALIDETKPPEEAMPPKASPAMPAMDGRRAVASTRSGTSRPPSDRRGSGGAVITAVLATLVTVAALAVLLVASRDAWLPRIAPELVAASGQGPRLDALDSRVGALQNEFRAQSATDPAQAIGQLSARLDALETRLADLVVLPRDNTAPTPAAPDPELVRKLDEAVQVARGSADARTVTELSERVGRLAEQVSGFEKQLAQLTEGADQVATDAARRTGLALGVGQLVSEIARGAPYAKSLAVLRPLVPKDGELAAPLNELAPYAEVGVPTLGALDARFPAIRDAALRAEAAAAQGDGWWGRVKSFFATLVVIRRTDDGGGEQSRGAQGDLADVEQALSAQDLPRAIEAAERIDGQARAPLADWLADLKARRSADQAASNLAARTAAALAEARAPAEVR